MFHEYPTNVTQIFLDGSKNITVVFSLVDKAVPNIHCVSNHQSCSCVITNALLLTTLCNWISHTTIVTGIQTNS